MPPAVVEEAGVDMPKMFVVLGPQVTMVKKLFATRDSLEAEG